jgi:hypothetical protein
MLTGGLLTSGRDNPLELLLHLYKPAAHHGRIVLGFTPSEGIIDN